MVPFLDMDKVGRTQYCVICGVGSGETTEVDKISLLLTAFTNLSLISFIIFCLPLSFAKCTQTSHEIRFCRHILMLACVARAIAGYMVTPAGCPAIQVHLSLNETCIVWFFADTGISNVSLSFPTRSFTIALTTLTVP